MANHLFNNTARRVCDNYSRNANERCISPVEEGAIEDL